MKKKKYLPIYKVWVKNGFMVAIPKLNVGWCSGLCDEFYHDDLFKIIMPTLEDRIELDSNGLNTFCWGSNSKDYKFRKFTTLRQTIVLFMAAMNDEI